MSRSMSRRDLAKAAAVAPLVAAADTPSRPEFDSLHYSLEAYQSAPLRLTFAAATQTEAEAWQKQLRAKLRELVGGFPARSGLNAQTIETRDFPNYRREKFIFSSRPGMLVQGYLLTPKRGSAPFVPVICIPGHGRGADDIVGIDEHGNDRSQRTGYQFDFAVQMAEQGMAAVAIEPLGFGCRRDPASRAKGAGQSSCQPSAGAALLLGQTMIGWRVWDVMRTIDWIEQRPELDARRVACAGISGGGTCTQFAAALDTRIQAALISGYLNTYRDSIMSISHCIDNYVPGILNWCESYDVAGLIAPRFLFSEGGDKDPIFPVAATKASFERVKKVYRVCGVPERAQQHIFAGEHVFNGSQAIPFLAKSLAVAAH